MQLAKEIPVFRICIGLDVAPTIFLNAAPDPGFAITLKIKFLQSLPVSCYLFKVNFTCQEHIKNAGVGLKSIFEQ
jgi:hypothetical protein